MRGSSSGAMPLPVSARRRRRPSRGLAHLHRHPAARRRVGEGVVEQVVEGALEQPDVGGDERVGAPGMAGQCLQRHAVALGVEVELLHHVLGELGERHRLDLEPRLLDVEAGELEELRHQLAEVLGMAGGDVEVEAALLLARAILP